MCKGKKCLGKNETNKLNFLERKWHRKSDIMNTRRWDLFQFAYFTTNLCTSPPWQMREDRRLIFIPELWKRNKKKISIDNLKKIEISCQPQGGVGGGVFGAWGQLGAAGIDWCMMQYFDDSLNFSGCNSHRLSFDIEFRDTSPLTLLLVVNAMLLS